MITEVEEEAARRWDIVMRSVSPLDAIWDDEDALEQWREKESGRVYAYARYEIQKRKIAKFEQIPGAAEMAVQIGVLLQEARLSAGFDLDDMKDLTGIRPGAAESIESGFFFKVTSVEEARRVIRAYSHATRVNGEDLVRQYDELMAHATE